MVCWLCYGHVVIFKYILLLSIVQPNWTLLLNEDNILQGFFLFFYKWISQGLGWCSTTGSPTFNIYSYGEMYYTETGRGGIATANNIQIGMQHHCNMKRIDNFIPMNVLGLLGQIHRGSKFLLWIFVLQQANAVVTNHLVMPCQDIANILLKFVLNTNQTINLVRPPLL